MKVLFVSSGNSPQGLSVIVREQGRSLEHHGVIVEYYPIKGRGVWGYAAAVPRLRRFLTMHSFDLVHAHYSLSAFVAGVAAPGLPVLTSLMGTDVYRGSISNALNRMCATYLWSGIVVKSERMKGRLGLENAHVIPNGVDFSRFVPMAQDEAQRKVGFAARLRHVVFMADPSRSEKNFELALQAFNQFRSRRDGVLLHTIYAVDHECVPMYLNAADVLLLTSRWEGSPNVIKEAMACSCPIVATDVGDVRETIGRTRGCFVTTFDVNDVAAKLERAIDFGQRTEGRDDIRHLDSCAIARRLIGLYESLHRVE